MPLFVLFLILTQSYKYYFSWFLVEKIRTQQSYIARHELCVSGALCVLLLYNPIYWFSKKKKIGRKKLIKPKDLLLVTQLVSSRARTWIPVLLTHIPMRFSLHQDTLAPEPQVTAPNSCVYLSCMSQLVLLAEQKLLKRILNLHLSTPLHLHS